MKRFSAPPSVYADPTRPPDDDDSDASSLSDGSKKVKTAQSFESLFNSESLSDIVLDINRGEYVFHAHKMIVGLKSERLAALITNVIAMPPDNSGGKPVLYLQEPSECSAVFSRFLYFIYSGAVWLHRDYVVPLFQLSTKYGVAALAAHCENYIVQILNKMLLIDASLPLTQSLQISSVGDLYEDPGYRDETKKVAFQVLCKRFADLVRTERWIAACWTTVRDLLHSDDCTSEENLILVSATDWMKRNKLQDKARIQEILSSIRYPRLPRRVLYHLHATSSFKKFPPVQDLIEAAIRYHCFKDVPEAQSEFSGLQYRARGRHHHHNNNSNNNYNNNNNNDDSNRNSRHTTMCGVENDDNNNNNNNNNSNNNNNINSNNSPSPDIDEDDNSLLQLQQAAASPDQQQLNQNHAPLFLGEFNTTLSSLLPPSSSSALLSSSSPSSSSAATVLLRNGNGGGGSGGDIVCSPHPQSHSHSHHRAVENLRGIGGISIIHSSDSTNTEPSNIPNPATAPITNPTTAPTLPVRHHRSRSEDRHGTPLRDNHHHHRITAKATLGSRHLHHHHNNISTTTTSSTSSANASPLRHFSGGAGFEPPAISSFHSPRSPVATIQPLVVHGQITTTTATTRQSSDYNDDDNIEDDDGLNLMDRDLLGSRSSISPLLSNYNIISSSGSGNTNNLANSNSGGGGGNNNNTYDNIEFDNNNVICHSHIRKL